MAIADSTNTDATPSSLETRVYLKVNLLRSVEGSPDSPAEFNDLFYVPFTFNNVTVTNQAIPALHKTVMMNSLWNSIDLITVAGTVDWSGGPV